MKLQIIELAVSGVKKIKAAKVAFSDKINVITGKTQQGKTTLLETLVMAFNGLKQGPRDLVSHGESVGHITTIFTVNGVKYKIDRKLSADGSPTLDVYELHDDGSRPTKKSSPQSFLKNLLVGETPGAFLKKSALDKLKFVMEQHGTDTASFDNKLNQLSGKRAELAAQVKLFAGYENESTQPIDNTEDLKAQLDERNKVYKEALSDLDAQINAVETQQSELYNQETNYNNKEASLGIPAISKKVDNLKVTLQQQDMQILQLEAQLSLLKKSREDNLNLLNKTETELAQAEVQLGKRPDVRELKAQLQEKRAQLATLKSTMKAPDVSDINTQIQAIALALQEYAKYMEKHTKYVELAAALQSTEKAIKDIRMEKKKFVASIPTKVEGLSIVIDEDGRPDGLYVNGVFSEEWSGAEGFFVAAKIMQSYTEQTVLIIDQGEGLFYDQAAFKNFCEWAEASGVQVIISVVGTPELNDNDDVKGFLVEEGEIRTVEVNEEDIL